MATQEYTQEQLKEMVNSEDWYERREAAVQGFELDKLVSDRDADVRAVVAEQAGKLGRTDLLEKLIDDKVYWVREAVAEQGYGLEKLIDDKDRSVRFMARQALEKLENEQ